METGNGRGVRRIGGKWGRSRGSEGYLPGRILTTGERRRGRPSGRGGSLPLRGGSPIANSSRPLHRG